VYSPQAKDQRSFQASPLGRERITAEILRPDKSGLRMTAAGEPCGTLRNILAVALIVV
jgi:hypothetical protein